MTRETTGGRFSARRWSTVGAPAVLGAGLLLAAGCQAPPAGEGDATASSAPAQTTGTREVVVSAQQGLPFSPAVKATGPLLFLSGQVGTRPGSTELVEGGIGPETRQTLENIRATLEEAGASMADVVKCTAFLDDMSEWGAMNEVYREFFPGDPPARSALGADGLALGAAVEIECIAVAPGG